MDYSSNYGMTDSPSIITQMFSGALGVFWIIFAIAVIIACWKIFEKAGEAGWKTLIPIYNIVILYRITWGSGLYCLLLLIPFVNVIIQLVTLYKLAKSFGQGIGFFFGLWLLSPIFMLLLGFGSYEYQGPGGIYGEENHQSADDYREF